MKAIIKIKDTIKGTLRAVAVVTNTHLSGATVELALAEFTRMTGKAPAITATEIIVVEVK